MKVGVQVAIFAFEVLLHDGVVALRVPASDHQATVGKHGPAVMFEPEPLGAFDPDNLPAGLLFRFLLFGTFQLRSRRFKGGHGA